jgi:hypothetical protein
LSLQGLPLPGAWTQPPGTAGSHPSSVQGSASSQFGGVPGVHAPLWHVSAPLQGLPSEHELPFALAVIWQNPPVQASSVQGFMSLQSAALLHDTCTVTGWRIAPGPGTPAA